MLRRFSAVAWFTIFASVFCSGLALGQSDQPFPYRPIRMVTPPAGGNLDVVARIIAQALAPVLGQPVIVYNRIHLIGIETVVNGTPDGYTTLFGASAVWTMPLLQRVSYDPVKDLIPIARVTRAPLFLYTNASLPAKSVRELIALAKANPGKYNYGIGGVGTASHLAAELFNNAAGIDVVRIAYKGAGAVVAGIIANQVHFTFASLSVGMPQVDVGRLRVLGVGNSEPSSLAPKVPTVASQGLPGFEVDTTYCMWVPVRTPKPIIDKLSKAVLGVLDDAKVVKAFRSRDTEVVGATPEQTAAFIKAEIVKWSKLVEQAHMRVN